MVAASKNTEREAREARERLRRYNARQSVHSHQLARRKRDNMLAIGAVVVVAALATVAQLFYFNGGPGTPTPAPSASPSAAAAPANVGDVPDPSLAEGRDWTGEMTLNDVPLGITLNGALAPQAVSSFVASVQSGFYIGTTCHRLVQSDSANLLQCGSFDGTGATDPTYSFGPIENAAVGGIYPTATIAMARASNNAYSNGRQFFIVLSDSVIPDDSAGGYTVIGTVTTGLDQLIAQITSAGVLEGATDGLPAVATTITALTIQ
ncbi:MAG: peptidylprolyl isomerase [Salinibacterium sp.]|nr:peptidylprolyl isomerase [Salinibacterium sp.]